MPFPLIYWLWWSSVLGLPDWEPKKPDARAQAQEGQ